LQVISSAAVVKCKLSFENMKSSRMVKVNQLCKKQFYSIIFQEE